MEFDETFKKLVDSMIEPTRKERIAYYGEENISGETLDLLKIGLPKFLNETIEFASSFK